MPLRYGLENFKCFGSLQTMEFAPITLIYGRNSSGKSSLIQSLMLLKQSFESPTRGVHDLAPKGPLVDLGSYSTYVHGHDVRKGLRFQLDFHLDSTRPALIASVELEYTMESRRKRQRRLRRAAELDPHRSMPAAADEALDDSGPWEFLNKVTATMLSPHGDVLLRIPLQRALAEGGDLSEAVTGNVYRTRTFRLARHADAVALADQLQSPGFSEALEQLNSGRGGPGSPFAILKEPVGTPSKLTPPSMPRADLVSTLRDLRLQGSPFPTMSFIGWGKGSRKDDLHGLAGVLDHLGGGLLRVLNTMALVGPLRAPPARVYELANSPGRSVGIRGEFMPSLLASSAPDRLTELNAWIQKLGIPYELTVRLQDLAPAGAFIVLALRDTRTGVMVTPSDVGFGVGQLLPILAQGILGDSSTTCVMQPELHLHPRLQAALGDFFIGTTFPEAVVALRGHDPVQHWIIETHSEALMLRIQRRIREGRLSNEHVSVLYVDDSDGSSRVLRLRLDEQGRFIDEWPGGFFEESFRELFPEE